MTHLRIRPRYYRWHVDPGIEWIETNTGYACLDWNVPVGRAALVLVDVWAEHYLRDTAARIDRIVHERLAPLLTACRQTPTGPSRATIPMLASGP